VTARIAVLIDKQDALEIVRDAIATILLEESLQQQILAQPVTIAYSRADDSDYTVTGAATLVSEGPGTEVSAKTLQVGDYVVTAGTLVAGVGEWTCVAPDATEDTCTTTAADDDLTFTTLGIEFTTTAGDAVWDTGDVITASVAGADDPLLWKLRVFQHRAHPFEEWLTSPPQDASAAAPIVAIEFSRDSVEMAKSNVFESQQYDAEFVLHCCGYGIATETADGHTPGDLKASQEAFRAATLVRNILMATEYDHLGREDNGDVADRMIKSREFGRPTGGDKQPLPNVAVMTLTLTVDLRETVEQIEGTDATSFLITVTRQETGETYLTITGDLTD